MPKRSTKKKTVSKNEVSAKVPAVSTIDSWGDVKPQRLPTKTNQVFISSLNGYSLQLSLTDDSKLSHFRKYLTAQIEKHFRFLSADINEKWEAAGAGSPRGTTEDLARKCDIFIGILVDEYGFIDQSGLSATHIEFDAAYQDSPEKMLIFIQGTLKDSKSETYKKLPLAYRDLLSDLQAYRGGKIVNFFQAWDELPELVLKALDRYCADTLRAIRRMPAYASDKSDEEMNWEQMTFRQRHEKMLDTFSAKAPGIRMQGSEIDRLSHDAKKPDPQRYLLHAHQGAKEHLLPVILSACPDRYSYPDAASYVGYPFRTRVESWDEPIGPLDIILFFRTITDSQIRRHLGNPDIHVTREGWGYFAADPERYIQAAYLLNCTSSRDLQLKVRQFLTWLDEYEQLGTLIARARVRGRILQAENEARTFPK
ncbi:MAG TPA: DUF4062 domain-containing protein [Pyrinomonadaceae bacterium]|nr:DUF4062 domain-containing protein [Pyrinomonadaceae bacterium]